MVFDLRVIIRDWAGAGVLDVVAPFALFFTIMYAVLQRSHILGDRSLKSEYDKAKSAKSPNLGELYNSYTGKKFNVVVAFVFAALAIIPHVYYGGRPDDGRMQIGARLFPDPVEIINNSLPTITVWIVAILMVLLILGLFGAKMEVFGFPLSGFLALLALGVVVYVFGAAASIWKLPVWARSWGLTNPETLFGLLMVFIFALVIYFIVKEPKAPDTSTDYPKKGSFGENVHKMFTESKKP